MKGLELFSCLGSKWAQLVHSLERDIREAKCQCRTAAGLDQWRPWSCDPVRDSKCTVGAHVLAPAGVRCFHTWGNQQAYQMPARLSFADLSNLRHQLAAMASSRQFTVYTWA